MKVMTLLFAVLWSSSAVAESTEVRDQVANWMTKNVIGRSVSTTKQSYSDGGKIYTEETITRIYSDFTTTSKGLKYRAFNIVKQQIFDVVDGTISRPGRDTSRAILNECEARQMVFDNKSLSGFCRSLAVSGYDTTGMTDATTWTIEGDKLKLSSKSNGLRECYGVAGSFFPCSIESTNVLYMIDGKLQSDGSSTTYKIDVETGKVIEISSSSTSAYREQ